MLIVGPDDHPRRSVGAGAPEHLKFHIGELIPAVLSLQVYLAEFPLAQRVIAAALEAVLLLFFGNAEVELDQQGTLAHQVFFKTDHPAHKIVIFFFGTEAEHRLHHRPVVPAAVEENDLAAPGELCDIPLEEPLGALLLGGFAQCHHPVAFFVHVTGDPPDGAPFTGSIPAFENDNHALSGLFQRFLHLDQFRLIGPQFQLPAVALQRLAVPGFQSQVIRFQTQIVPAQLLQIQRRGFYLFRVLIHFCRGHFRFFIVDFPHHQIPLTRKVPFIVPRPFHSIHA